MMAAKTRIPSAKKWYLYTLVNIFEYFQFINYSQAGTFVHGTRRVAEVFELRNVEKLLHFFQFFDSQSLPPGFDQSTNLEW